MKRATYFLLSGLITDEANSLSVESLVEIHGEKAASVLEHRLGELVNAQRELDALYGSYPKDYIDFAPYNMPVAERRSLGVGDIYINQIRCKKCGWYIRSKNRHHQVTCKCGAVSIDGGSWYSKISGDPADVEMHVLSYKHIEPTLPKP